MRFGERSHVEEEESTVSLSGFLSEQIGAKWRGSGGRPSGALKRGWAWARAAHEAQAACSEQCSSDATVEWHEHRQGRGRG
jgi:hypothetical protein